LRPSATIAFLSASALLCGACGSHSAGVPGPSTRESTTGDGNDGGGAELLDITVTPLTLSPRFSPSIHDYYVRCAAGDNLVTLQTLDGSGLSSTTFHMLEDQEIEVGGQYWIRCLPHDFPTITVTFHPMAGSPTPGFYLVDSGKYGIVLDTQGTPVWYARASNVLNVDSLAPNTISLMPNAVGAFGTSATGRYDMYALDSATTTTLMAVGSPTDGHELRALPNGNHLLLTYPTEEGVDLTGLQTYGSEETMADCEVQELDPAGQLVWSWLASDHLDPRQESMQPLLQSVNGTSLVDVFHFNSIEVDTQGNLLLSARHANAVYYVERPSGKVLWKLGGTAYNKDGAPHIEVVGDPQTTFSLQHDARFVPNGHLTLFDDHGASPGVARGVEYMLDFEANTAKVAFQFQGTAQSEYEGSFRRYPDGESVVGWGYIPSDPRVVTEVNATGQDVLDIAFGGQNSYRAIKVPLSALDIRLLRSTTPIASAN
jgi:hypothetical protein